MFIITQPASVGKFQKLGWICINIFNINVIDSDYDLYTNADYI